MSLCIFHSSIEIFNCSACTLHHVISYYNLRLTLPVLFFLPLIQPNKYVASVCLLASMTSVLLGYDIGIMSGAILFIEEDMDLSTGSVLDSSLILFVCLRQSFCIKSPPLSRFPVSTSVHESYSMIAHHF